jgi:phosphatidylserine/phosphatidylglycerophosphate/cardiolipin synthase-like enzyme
MTPIIEPGRNAWRTARARASGVIIDAADYYYDFYEAARQAKRYVLMSGWQFDTGVELLRGTDAPPGAEVHFLKFLVGLCRQNPELDIYILAWNFHPVLLGEREWLQRLRFSFGTSKRIHFRFDDCPIPGGSHHQKFVVVDGAVAFLGGIDVCEARWDDRRHCGKNDVRLSRGRPQKPYHDVQAYVAGDDAVKALEALFTERWERCTSGGKLSLPEVSRAPILVPRVSVEMGEANVAFSRTDPRSADDITREVEHLFVDAIERAERLIYIETQYFSSRKVYEALRDRMRAVGRPKPEIVIVVNERAEAPKEELAVGLRQAQNVECLRKVAAATGTRLGMYYSICDKATDQFRCTYIHSKVISVDDRFLTVGSANVTNRSMALDSELHISWEVPEHEIHESELGRAIRSVRVELLRDHAGLSEAGDLETVGALEGVVAFLDAVTQRRDTRLQTLGPPSPAEQLALEVVNPRNLPFDPEMPEEHPHHALDEPMDELRGWRNIHVPALGSVLRQISKKFALPAFAGRREAGGGPRL